MTNLNGVGKGLLTSLKTPFKGRRVPFDEQGRNSPLMKNQITCLSQNINGSKKLNRIGNLYRTLGCDVLLFQ